MSVFRRYWFGLALVLMQAPLPAPAQYPPGNGGLGIPFPRRHKKEEQAAQLQSTSGMLRRIQKDQIIVEADDHRILNFKRTGTTQFLKMGNAIKPAELTPGDYIEVEASEDEEGFLTAANVMWQQDGSAKDRKHAAEPVEISVAKGSHDHQKDSAKDSKESSDGSVEAAKDTAAPEPAAKPAAQAAAQASPPPADDPSPADLKTPIKEEVKSVQIDRDDQGPPVLQRGGKSVRREVEPARASAAPSAPPSTAAAAELSARNEPPANEAEPPVRGPQRPEEVIIEKARQAAGAFLEGLPNYVCQEIMTRYQSESNSKNWMPHDVISMALVYEHGQESYRDLSINGKPTKKGIEDLSGSWSTGEFGSVLRIEMQATHIPDAFPSDKVEMATDYEFVRFADRQFLVPVHAESMGCQRDTSTCTRNAIDFRNYHKYSGESSITFEK